MRPKIAMSKNIQLEGFMAYSGTASHTKTFAARCKQSEMDLAGVNETIALAKDAGATVLMETMPITETSAWAVISDLDGNSIGLFEGTVG